MAEDLHLNLDARDGSPDEDDNSSQITEDDPRVPENQENITSGSVPQPLSPPATSQQAAPRPTRERPRYELQRTIVGHSSSISAVKFSPDGSLLASSGECYIFLSETVHLTALYCSKR